MHDAYIRRNILPVVIFQAGNAHKQGAVLVGTDYMAGPFVVEVFVVSFSNLGNVKSWILLFLIDEVEYPVLKYCIISHKPALWFEYSIFS